VKFYKLNAGILAVRMPTSALN